jgi:hypothetical protein
MDLFQKTDTFAMAIAVQVSRLSKNRADVNDEKIRQKVSGVGRQSHPNCISVAVGQRMRNPTDEKACDLLCV